MGAAVDLKYGFMDMRVKSLVNTLYLPYTVFFQAAMELVLEQFQSLLK